MEWAGGDLGSWSFFYMIQQFRVREDMPCLSGGCLQEFPAAIGYTAINRLLDRTKVRSLGNLENNIFRRVRDLLNYTRGMMFMAVPT